jgi:hypothetical protein
MRYSKPFLATEGVCFLHVLIGNLLVKEEGKRALFLKKG